MIETRSYAGELAMKRTACVTLAGWCLAAWALGQATQGPPPPPPPPAPPVQRTPPARPAAEAPLQDEAKLRWICKQLRLDQNQMQQAEALIVAYQAELKDMEAHTAEVLQRIQDKYAEVQAARTAGDEERVKKLQEELGGLSPEAIAEGHFIDALQDALTPEQKSKLPAIQKRAALPQGQSLRPVYVLRAARKLALTPEQDSQLEKVLDEFRTSVQSTPPGQANEERSEQFISSVRAVLTPTQAESFDKELATLRENPPTPQPFQPPGAATRPTPAAPATPVAPAKPVKPGGEQ